jgi:peroxiredoxin
MHRATKDLAESGILAGTVKVGDPAPDFVLKNTGNQDVSLSQLTERGPLVLSVYRGRW